MLLVKHVDDFLSDTPSAKGILGLDHPDQRPVALESFSLALLSQVRTAEFHLGLSRVTRNYSTKDVQARGQIPSRNGLFGNCGNDH